MTYERYGQVSSIPYPTAVPMTSWPVAGQPVAPPRRRIPRWIMWVAVVTAIMSVVTFTTVLLWPGGEQPADEPLAFHPFTYVARIQYDHPSATHLNTIDADTGYVAWEQEGKLRVRAVNLADGSQRWQTTLDGASRWERLYAGGGLLLVLAQENDPTKARPMQVLRASDGELLWDRQVRGDDGVVFGAQYLIWVDRSGPALRGIDPATGRELWQRELLGQDIDLTAVVTEQEQGLRTSPSGEAIEIASDHRLVLIESDGRAQVIDGRDGQVLTEDSNVATPADQVLAYQDRLYVAQDEAGYEVISYQLEDLSVPSIIHYRSADRERYPDELLPCGSGRVCLLDTYAYDDSSLEVVVIAPDGGGEVWRRPAPYATRLLPVADWVAVNQGDRFNPSVTVWDSNGEVVLEQKGLAIRLNYGNLLVLNGNLSDSPEHLRAVGIATAVGELVELGSVPPVTGPGCSWNEQYLLCAGRSTAEVWRFADPQ